MLHHYHTYFVTSLCLNCLFTRGQLSPWNYSLCWKTFSRNNTSLKWVSKKASLQKAISAIACFTEHLSRHNTLPHARLSKPGTLKPLEYRGLICSWRISVPHGYSKKLGRSLFGSQPENQPAKRWCCEWGKAAPTIICFAVNSPSGLSQMKLRS